MPMKFSGRSVDEASRVIEIDDVLVATMASGLSDGAQIREDLALDVLLLGRGLDHQIAVGQRVVFLRRRDLRERVLARVLGDALLGDLTRHVAVDGRQTRLDAIGRHVVEHDRIARQRADMGNAVAHLPGADHADILNFLRHDFIRSMRSPALGFGFGMVRADLIRKPAPTFRDHALTIASLQFYANRAVTPPRITNLQRVNA